MLTARLGPHGHGPGFGVFLYPVKLVRLPLNEKTVGPFHTPGRVFFVGVLGFDSVSRFVYAPDVFGILARPRGGIDEQRDLQF